MKKVLVLTSVASMIDQFNRPNIEKLQQLGCEVHVAANFVFGNTSTNERIRKFKEKLIANGIKVYNIPFHRNVFDLGNLRVYLQLKTVMENEHYNIIHCQSPVGGALARIAANKMRKRGTKIIYTAHGFHFYKGAPLLNWLIFYPVEKWLSWFCDVLITINREDYERAKKFKTQKVVYLPGVGVETRKIANLNTDKCFKRKEIAIPEQGIIILSVGELNKNKNHETAIKAIAKLKNPNLYYVICGIGAREGYLKALCNKLSVADKVRFIGYRQDIAEIYKMADIFVFPSYREGLPVALMEAMAAGLPIVASFIRGNSDLIINGKGGFLCKANDENSFAKAIGQLVNDVDKRQNMGRENMDTIRKFDVAVVKHEMEKIYQEVL